MLLTLVPFRADRARHHGPDPDPDPDPARPGAAGTPCAAVRADDPAVRPAAPAVLRLVAAPPERQPALRPRRVELAQIDRQAGMTTAEYAVGTVAACGFAAVLWTVLRSGVVDNALTELVVRALHLL